MNCKTCIWFAKKDLELVAGFGYCRRYAPTGNGHPVVMDSDWCGDHKSSEKIEEVDEENGISSLRSTPEFTAEEARERVGSNVIRSRRFDPFHPNIC